MKDVAALHIAAILDPDVKNARLQAWGVNCNWNDVLAIMRKLYPSKKFIDDFPTNVQVSFTTDFSQPLALLKKWEHQDGWKTLEETVADNMEGLIKLEAQS